MNAFPGFDGSVRIASGDVNGDGFDDIIMAQGPGTGSGSQVRIFDGFDAIMLGVNTEIASFFVYSDQAGVSQNAGFGGGVFVASADFNGDGFDELAVSPGLGANGHLKVFDFNGASGFLGNAPVLRSSFFAYPGFAGEIRITTLRANGVEHLVTGSGAGSSLSDVRIYGSVFGIGEVDPSTNVPVVAQFFPYQDFPELIDVTTPLPGGGTGTERRITAFSGVSVAAGDVDGDGNDELFVSKNLGLSDVRVYKFGNLVSGGEYAKFVAFEGFQGEVRLGAADVDGDGRVEVLTSTGDSPGAGGAHVKAWRVTPGDAGELRSFFAYPGYSNGVFLGTNDFHWFQDFDSTAPVNIPDPGAFVGTSITVNPTTLVDSNRFRTMSIFIRIALLDPDGAGENSDLDVFLRDPRGVNHPLFTGANFFGDGFNIELTDSAPTALTFGTLPNVGTLTGRFRPETINLGSTFNNLGLAGTWTLTVRDTDGGNAYRLTDWGISFGF